MASACGSSTSTVTSPSSLTRCGVTVNGGGSLPAQGGSATLNVTAARECSWSASSDATWLSIRSGATGQGDGAVVVAAASNPDPAVRRGAVVLNDQRVEVTQAAGECSFSLGQASDTFPQTGGSGEVDLRASSSLCSWTVESDSDWIDLRADRNGRGSARVPFEVLPANGPTRRGSILIAGQRFEVAQSAGCVYAITPASHLAEASGSTGSIAIATEAGCAWTAASQVSWLSLSQGGGTGPGSVAFTVAPGDAARTGTATIAGRTFTVAQAAPAPGPAPSPGCSYAVEPRSHAVAGGGGAISVNVTAGSGCAWTASSPVSWITVTSGGSGAGSGTAGFAVAATSGPGRTATLTVAGQPVTVTQSAGCSITVSPDSVQMPAAGGTGLATVAGGAGCTWTAASNASWIQVTAGASGAGNGEVVFQVSATTAGARTGTLTIGGRTVTVNQAAGCTFSISPEQRDVEAAGATFDVDVTAPGGCSWQAQSNAAWISVQETGSRARVTVAPNVGAARTGTATIAGRTFTVNQAALVSACRYTVDPRDVRISSSAQIVRVTVTTSAACAWTAVSEETWIRVISGAAGLGGGEVSLAVEENRSDRRRRGRVIVAGEVVDIDQRGDDGSGGDD